jgi:putative transposase
MPWGLKRYYGTGSLHFITWSCYRRKPLLGNPVRRDLLLAVLDLMRVRYRFAVIGYVVMPEHVHLLISEPLISEPTIVDPSKIVQAVKLSVSRRLAISGEFSGRFWQSRFYDFNLWSPQKEVEKLRLHASQSGGARTGGESGRLALEQLPILRIRRGGIGSDQRLDLVGGENSAERRLRFKYASKSGLGETWVGVPISRVLCEKWGF